MNEVTYTLMCEGRECGSITRTQVHKGKSYDRVVEPMFEAVIKANKIASELFLDSNTENYFSPYDREQTFIELLEVLNKAILAMKD